MRVDDMGTPRVPARRGDRELVRFQNRGDLEPLQRMLDPDPPAELRHWSARETDVAPGKDGKVPDPHIAEQLRRSVHRPALHKTRRVEPPSRSRVEVATRLLV